MNNLNELKFIDPNILIDFDLESHSFDLNSLDDLSINIEKSLTNLEFGFTWKCRIDTYGCGNSWRCSFRCDRKDIK